MAYKNNPATLAFEERYAFSENCSSAFFTPTARGQRRGPSERGATFDQYHAAPDWDMPAPPVQLAAIAGLAAHLIRSRTAPYRVRREQQTANSRYASYYVPQIDKEFLFSCLDLWWHSPSSSFSVLKRPGVLSPATRELIATAGTVFGQQRLPKHLSREEFEYLSQDKQQRLLIAQHMRDWHLVPENKRQEKLWKHRHREATRAFLDEWGVLAARPDALVLRAELKYPAMPAKIDGFGAVSHVRVRKDVQHFVTNVQSSTLFDGGKCLVQPYADLAGNWHLPLLLCVPIRDPQRQSGLPGALLRHWAAAVGDDGVSLRWQSNHLDCAYRFISPDQMRFDTATHHITAAASYFFASLEIADTTIDTVAPL